MPSSYKTHLSWPLASPINKDIEWSYLDKDGKEQVHFEQEAALAALLLDDVVFLNTHWWEETWPEKAKETLSLNVNTSDIFAWGVADAEGITLSEVEEVYRFWIKDKTWGTAVWAIIHNKEMPQKPVEVKIREAGIWDLDALKKEHNLKSNWYDGISHVLATQKRELYLAWCETQGTILLPYDGTWWQGWREYAQAHPNWYNDEYKKEEARRREEFKNTW